MSTLTNEEFQAQMKERFAQLPKVVQDSITSADVEQRMRELANVHKLHIDQYETLENEVMLALLGFQKVEDLQKNIQNEVKVDEQTAAALATDVSKIVFEPVRGELERQLEHPDAKPQTGTGVEEVRKETLKAEAAPAVLPATPPPEQNKEKVTRAPITESYKPGQASNARKEVHDDPYREPPA